MWETDTDHVALWRAMEQLVYKGKARSIGVSSFGSKQVEAISAVAKVPIATNQVRLLGCYMPSWAGGHILGYFIYRFMIDASFINSIPLRWSSICTVNKRY